MTDIEKLTERVEKLEELYHSQNENLIKNKYELKELISKAVSDGNKPVIDKLENHDKRIAELENKEAKIVLERWKSIITTTIAWFLLGILNNLPYLIKLISGGAKN